MRVVPVNKILWYKFGCKKKQSKFRKSCWNYVYKPHLKTLLKNSLK